MRRRLAALSMIAAMYAAGCASTTGAPDMPPLPEAVRSAPEQYLLVTVVNEPAPLPSRAGSTLRGYDGAASYSVTRSARSLAHAIAADYQLQEVTAWPITALRVHCILYRIPTADSREHMLARLSADPRVKLAQPLQSFATSAAAAVDARYNDPYVGLQRGLWEMSVVAAHRWSRGDGATVAIIDTGVAASHPDLKGRIQATRNFVDHDDAQFERDRHGTEVAGVIAAVGNNGQGIVGVAPRVHLLALKACWQGTAGGSGAVCNTFTLAQALGAAINANADVINLSLVGPADPLLAALTQAAIEQGAIVVGAVPATGRMDGFPAGVPGVIAVDMTEQAAPAKQALRAPGRDVLTLAPEGHYDFATGSSLAAANVSGIVALMRARQRQMTGATAHLLLARSTQYLAGPAVASINACTALSALLTSGGCPEAGEASSRATASVAKDGDADR